MDKRALNKLSYGVYIVASALGEEKAGYIANTVFQISSTPPLVAISCHKNNSTLRFILESGVFSVSVLEKNTAATLIGEFGYFSSSDADKFTKVKTEVKTTGAPVVVDSSTAWLDCRVKDTLDVGTHILITGEVEDCGTLSDSEPLTYAWYREHFKAASPPNAPTYVKNPEPVPSGPSGISTSEALPANDPESKVTYICDICGYVYRPDDGDQSAGIPPDTSFTDLPDSYRCPVCNAGKDYFRPMD